MSRTRPEVVAFDVNETLLDLAPVRAALVEAGQEPAPAGHGLRPHPADRHGRGP